MTTRKTNKKGTLKKKSFYGVEKFEKDLEKEYGPMTFGSLLESHSKCEEWTHSKHRLYLH